jgi:hypothetical protein
VRLKARSWLGLWDRGFEAQNSGEVMAQAP